MQTPASHEPARTGPGSKYPWLRRLSVGLVLLPCICFSAARTNATDLLVTNISDSGPGSLRQAILDANANASADRIMCTNLSGTIRLATPLPQITGGTTLVGPGANLLTISGSNSVRVFEIAAGAGLAITGMTIANGHVKGGGAGISNAGSLTLVRCAVLANWTDEGPGGGILSRGSLTIISSVIASNLAWPSSDALGSDLRGVGAGLYVDGGSVTISNSSLNRNQTIGGSTSDLLFAYGGAALGGALFVLNGDVTIAASTVYSNLTVGGYGGQPANGGPGGNGYGGGIYVSNGMVRLINCTISGNEARGGPGGGGIHYGGNGGSGIGGGIYAGGGSVSLVNCTVVRNSGVGGPGGLAGGGYPSSDGLPGVGMDQGVYSVGGVNLLNNILQSSGGVFNSQGYNLVQSSLPDIVGLTESDLRGVANEAQLADNGGPTITHALPLDSPALDAGSSLGAPAFDARGVPRPQSLGVDIGAFELVAGAPQTLAASNRNVIAGDTLDLSLKVFGALPLSFQWIKDGSTLPGATNLALYFDEIHVDDAGSYRLVLSNCFGSVTSAPIAVAVRVFAPAIVGAPADQYPPLNGVALFCVTASGSRPLHHRWRFNGTNLPGGSSPDLVVIPRSVADAGPYSVIVSNSVGSVTSSPAYLSLLPVPVPPKLVGWGNNSYGQLVAPANLTNVAEIVAGSSSSLALQSDGRVIGWGYGSTNVPIGLTNVRAIAGGIGGHFLALRRDGSVVAWGGPNYYGETNVPAGLTGVAAIAAGYCQTMALKSNGTVITWGYSIAAPAAWLQDVRAVAAGQCHCLALRSNGTVVAWGWNDYGQTTVPSGLSNVIAVAAGLWFSAALRNDGTIVAWGARPQGLGDPVFTAGVCGLGALSAGPYSLAGVRDDGALVLWGPPSLAPPAGLWGITKIAMASTHFLALGRKPFAPVVANVSGAQTVVAGSRLELTAMASGTGPLSYQWRKDGRNIWQGTNAMLEIPRVRDSAGGQYAVVITNALGAVTSDVVQVTVLYPIQMDIAGGGTVSRSPEVAGYHDGQTVGLVASPAPGWQFLQWLGDVAGTNPTNNLLMTRTEYVEAVFGTTLNAAGTGNGAIVVDPVAALYPCGTVVRLTAVPQPGHSFVAWGNAASGTNNPLLFPVTNANPTVSCSFAPLSAGQYALAVIPDGRGRVTTSPRGNWFNSGQSVTLTAWLDPDQDFLGWTGDASGAQTNLVVVMNQSRTITANFTRRPRLWLGPCLGGPREEGFQLTLTGDFGARYAIDASTDLVRWTSLVAVTNPFGTVQFVDGDATNQVSRFYRALLQP